MVGVSARSSHESLLTAAQARGRPFLARGGRASLLCRSALDKRAHNHRRSRPGLREGFHSTNRLFVLSRRASAAHAERADAMATDADPTGRSASGVKGPCATLIVAVASATPPSATEPLRNVVIARHSRVSLDSSPLRWSWTASVTLRSVRSPAESLRSSAVRSEKCSAKPCQFTVVGSSDLENLFRRQVLHIRHEERNFHSANHLSTPTLLARGDQSQGSLIVGVRSSYRHAPLLAA